MKLKNKEKRLCNGKLIVTDFKRLNLKNLLLIQDFTLEQFNKEIATCTVDGKIYVNASIDGNEMVYGIFENFMTQDIKTLKGFQEIYKEKFPHIQTFDDWSNWVTVAEDRQQIIFALAVLMVPVELQRRKIEANYYGKIRAFPSYLKTKI